MSVINKQRSDQIFWGVVFIGLALLFWLNWWWPGILFVVGIAAIVRNVAEGKTWSSDRGALVLLAVGLVFALGDRLDLLGSLGGALWPLLLIVVGLYLLYGQRARIS
jgi:hypothetical protein